ncbi:hypothetical protein [Methylomarinum vadi]|uniref:hypothetical protein n=1 Tax=Methylomarinum vadi TaxID=438855 RepID=UPI0012694F41|nr:hypothetical protein [Methylomarinum vadi]
MKYFFIFPILICSALVPCAAMPTSDEVLKLIGLHSDQISKLNSGEPISHEISEESEKELATITTIYLEYPLHSVTEFIKNNYLSVMHDNVLAHGKIPDNASIGTFKAFYFQEAQTSEALALLNAESGDQFNLSSSEIKELSEIRKNQHDAKQQDLLFSISKVYQKILYNRWRQYKDHGIEGIAEYSRENENVKPGLELQGALKSCKVLSGLFSGLFNDLSNHPNRFSLGVEESYYWLNRALEDRPTAILGHRVFQETRQGAIVVDRQFYVSHSYNTTHHILGAVPYLNGTLIFHAVRTFTDQVLGVGSIIRHNLGRNYLKAELIHRLLKLKQSVECDRGTDDNRF